MITSPSIIILPRKRLPHINRLTHPPIIPHKLRPISPTSLHSLIILLIFPITIKTDILIDFRVQHILGRDE